MNNKLILTILLALLASSLIMIACGNDGVSNKGNDDGDAVDTGDTGDTVAPPVIVKPDCSNVPGTEIDSPRDLGNIDMGFNGNYKLTSNIDLDSNDWKPIGFNEANNHISPTAFTGNFNGCGFTIKNLRINRPDDSYIGLFAKIGDGASKPTISNLIIEVQYTDIKGANYTGALAGESVAATITNVYVKGGAVSGENFVGGLVGALNTSTITGSAATGNVSGKAYVGGLVGALNASTITGSAATGNVNGTSFIGGLVGAINNASTIGTSYYTTGTVKGTDKQIGGLVGRAVNKNTILNAYAAGNVSGTGTATIVGRLLGQRDTGTTISNSYFDTGTTGPANGVGDGSQGGTTGLTKANITQADFVGWDFSTIWNFTINQWPRLRPRTP